LSLSRREFLAFGAGAVGVGLAGRVLAQKTPTTNSTFEGGDVLARLLKTANQETWHALPIGDLVGVTGLALIGTPYVGGTLETSDDTEACFVSLTRLDCVTFYEACLGFARVVKKSKGRLTPKSARPKLLKEIESMRYRGGHADGYLSRLHYTSDYFFDNDRRKIMRLITKYLPGAVATDKPLDFMSTHPNSYRQLKAHPEWVPRLAELEKQWTARKPMYIPNEVIPMVESLLETGDLIGIATSAHGLDTSHTGICLRDREGALRILHASSAHKQVELGPRLADYLGSVKKDIGIMVARPLEP